MSSKKIIVTDDDRDDFYDLMDSQLNAYDISDLAKAITVEVFRNGPVEDMHAAGKLSEEDMKTLNKYMVNKLARLLYLFEEEDSFGLCLLLNFARSCATEWDEPEIDLDELEELKKYANMDETIRFFKKNKMYGFE